MQLHRQLDAPIGYPHRPPCLRLESRRTSISVDDVVRRRFVTTIRCPLNHAPRHAHATAHSLYSGASSPDSNLLRVQANLPGRRHSDNTIQPPRILVTQVSHAG